MGNRANKEELHRRIENGSRNPDDFRHLAGLLTAAGETVKAIELLEQALGLATAALDRAGVVSQLAWLLYDRTPDLDRARLLANDGLRHLTDEPATPDVLFLRGMLQSLLAHERFTVDPRSGTEMARVALATFQRLFAEAADWDDEEAWLEAARVYCFVGDGEPAIPLVRRFLQVEVDECRRLHGLLVLAEAQRLAGVLREAETVAAEALGLAREHHPDSVHNAALGLGLIQKASGRLIEARQSLEEALAALEGQQDFVKNNRDWRQAINGPLAETYAALGEQEKAISAWQELLNWYADDDPARPKIMLCLADACDSAGSLPAARTWYQAVLAAPLASSEDRAEAQVSFLWTEGKLQHRSSECEAATRTFERLLDHYRDDDSDRRKVLAWLGDCYYAADHFAEALERYDEIASSPRASAEERRWAVRRAEQSKARDYYDAGRYAEAARSFEGMLQSVNNSPNRWRWVLWLGACYVRLGAYASATHCYQQVLQAPDATEEERASARRTLSEMKT